jgi:hypothetical protein
MTKAHPQVGGVRCKDQSAWRREHEAQKAGRSYAAALLALPADDGPGGFYRATYQSLIAEWPQRSAFLAERGVPGQLEAESLLIARLEELLS